MTEEKRVSVEWTISLAQYEPLKLYGAAAIPDESSRPLVAKRIRDELIEIVERDAPEYVAAAERIKAKLRERRF